MSQNSLTDIQKAMIERICESIAPAGGLDDNKFLSEAKALATFFYGNDSQTDEVVNYMKELGYICSDEMKDENGIALIDIAATLPDQLANRQYACEVHCYYENSRDQVLKCALAANILRVSANRVNKSNHSLFPVKQTFYLSDSSHVDKLLEELVEENKISSVKVGLPIQINWAEFYNIQIDGLAGQSELIDFHRTPNA